MPRKIDLEQNGSPEWLEWRMSGIGGSDIAAIMGVHPFKTKRELFFEKTCGISPPTNSAIRRGQEFEPIGRAMAEKHTQMKFTPTCFESNSMSIFRASLDGWSEWKDMGYILEVKDLGPKGLQTALEGKYPEYIYMQIQWQLMVSESQSAYLLIGTLGNDEYMLFEVDNDEEMQKKLQEAAMRFWHDHVLLGIEPEGKAKVIEDINLEVLCAEYKATTKAIKKLEDLRDKLKKDILVLGEDRGGGDCYICEGVTVSKVLGRKSYDYDRMEKDGIEIQKYCKVGAPYYTLRLEKEKTCN